MDNYDSKFDTADLGRIDDFYNEYENNDIDYNDNLDLNNTPQFEYPWYLSIWFIFALSALSFLIIPGLIAIALIKQREIQTEKLNYYFKQLEYQKLEVQNIYNRRDAINKMIEEKKKESFKAISEERATLIHDAEIEAYNIVQSAEVQKSQILKEFEAEEEEIRRRKAELTIVEKKLENNIESIIRKLNLFCGSINDFRKKATPEKFQEKYASIKSNEDEDQVKSLNYDFLKDLDNIGSSNDDISNTLKIKDND